MRGATAPSSEGSGSSAMGGGQPPNGVCDEVVAGIDRHHDGVGLQRQPDVLDAIVVLRRPRRRHAEIDRLHVVVAGTVHALLDEGRQGLLEERPLEKAVADQDGPEAHPGRPRERSRPVSQIPVVVDDFGRIT